MAEREKMGQRRDRKRERLPDARVWDSWRDESKRGEHDPANHAHDSVDSFRVTRSPGPHDPAAQRSGAGGSLPRVRADESERPPQQRKRCPRPSRVPDALEWPSLPPSNLLQCVHHFSPEKVPVVFVPSQPEENGRSD